MVHGEKDESVPVCYSRKVLKIFKMLKKNMSLLKMEIIVYLQKDG